MIFVIPCDYAGHTLVYDPSDKEKAKKILTNCVDDLVDNGYIEDSPELRTAIDTFDVDFLNETFSESGLFNMRDEPIMEFKTKWNKSTF